MFGIDIPASSHTTAQIKIRLGAGRPLTAWEGATDTPEHDVIDDISRKASVVSYLTKAIAKGRIKEDELGLVEVPAFLCVTDEVNREQVDEKPIKLVINLHVVDPDNTSAGLIMDKMFSQWNQALIRITEETQKTMNATATNAAKIIEASNQVVKDALKHESERADAAHKAVIDLLTSDKADKGSLIDDIAKAFETSERLEKFIERLIDKLPFLSKEKDKKGGN